MTKKSEKAMVNKSCQSMTAIKWEREANQKWPQCTNQYVDILSLFIERSAEVICLMMLCADCLTPSVMYSFKTCLTVQAAEMMLSAVEDKLENSLLFKRHTKASNEIRDGKSDGNVTLKEHSSVATTSGGVPSQRRRYWSNLVRAIWRRRLLGNQ